MQWASIKAGRATTLERAQFNLALSIAGVGLVRAVYIGRVDPALLRWKYEGPRKAIDAAALLQDARAGRGLGDVLRSLEPKVSHYVRARATLATYRALAAEGEPPPVPALPAGQKKVVPGQAWSGVPQLVRRGCRPWATSSRTSTRPIPTTPAASWTRSSASRHGTASRPTV